MPKEFGNGPPTADALYTILHDQLMCMVGTFVGVFLSGVLVTLGVSVFLLSSKKAKISKQDYLLRTYTVILISLVVAFEIQSFILGNAPVLTLFHTQSQVKELGTALIILFNLSLVATVGLTDGLMVWRCSMVQQALGPTLSLWGNIFWIFPACLWVVLTATGIGASIVNRGPIYDILGTTAYGANTALNLYATCFITIRLLIHRRLVKTRLGNNEAVTTHHLHIIGILLESAAINVPVAIVAAVGMGTGRAFIETVLTPTISASQALATVLIIHQVARDRALHNKKGAETEKPSSITTASHTSEAGPQT